MTTETSAVINEIARCLIRLPIDAGIYNDHRYIAIVFEEERNRVAPRLLALHRHKLRYLAQYEVLSELCDDRAQRTVDQSLLVNRKPVTPEHYLTTWRKAFAAAIDFDALRERYGLTVHACLKGHLAAARTFRSFWDGSPFQDFAQFEAMYGDRFNLGDQGNFETTFDLREPGLARDVWFVAQMAPQNERHCLSAHLELAGQARCQFAFGAALAAQGALEI